MGVKQMPERVRAAESQQTRNSPGKVEFEEALAERLELKSAMARLSKKLGTLDARWENIGGDPEALRDGERLHRLAGRSAQQGRVETFNQVASWLGLIQIEDNGQATFGKLFDGDALPAGDVASKPAASKPGVAEPLFSQINRLALAHADTDGYNSGWAGGSSENNPHLAGTDVYASWDSAWRDGNAARGERDKARGKPDTASVDVRKAKPAVSPKPATVKAKADKPAAKSATPAVPAPRGRRRLAEAPASAETSAEKAGWQGDRDFHGPDSPELPAPTIQ
jgi:ribosome modulation factor